jgi:DnaJ-class molecular chaperone
MGPLILILIIVAVGYFVSLRLHPLRKCPRCNMSGRHFGSIYTGSYRRCSKCGGRGQLDRFGTKLFFGGTNNTGNFTRR